MKCEYDVIILGGGCAGLSLASRLADLGLDRPRVLVLEKRVAYTNDRTWCFWDDGDFRARLLSRHQWQKMRVQTSQKAAKVDCGNTPYLMIPADVFYNDALSRIQKSKSIAIETGCGALRKVARHNGMWQVDTLTNTYSSAIVVDTRPQAEPRNGEATLWQSFLGHELECEDDRFDPSCLDLMDFFHSDANQILFTYMLPLSSRRALIEVTNFGPDPLGPQLLASDLTIAIQSRLRHSKFKILRSEQGILPMGNATFVQNQDPSYVYAGLTVGGARPCTGYAFQRIQRWAGACANRLAEAQMPIGHEGDSMALRSMDHLFLSVLRARPELAPDLFLSLFEKTESERMIRFLSDQGTAADYLNVISALPVVPFLQEFPNAFLSKAMHWQESLVS